MLHFFPPRSATIYLLIQDVLVLNDFCQLLILVFDQLQVIHMHIFGILLVFGVPSALGVMNLMWFGKIIKGLKKNLSKRL